MCILSSLLRIASIASLLVALVGLFFVAGGLFSGFAGDYGAMLRALLIGALTVSLGLGAYVGGWALADRLKP